MVGFDMPNCPCRSREGLKLEEDLVGLGTVPPIVREAVHGCLMTFYDVVSFEFSDYSGAEIIGTKIIVRFNDKVLKITGHDLEAVAEQLINTLDTSCK